MEKEIENLRVANLNLTNCKDSCSQEQRPRDTTYTVQARNTTYTKSSQEMTTSQYSSQCSEVFETNVTYDVPKNNRKRTANEQNQSANGAKDNSVRAAKRSLLRKSIETNDTKGEVSEYVTAPEFCDDTNQTNITEVKNQRRSRRSISLPPDEVPSVEIITSNQTLTLKTHKRVTRRFIGVKNTRISSSCDDL